MKPRFAIFMLVMILTLTSCSSSQASESNVQTAIAQTQNSIPTNTKIPNTPTAISLIDIDLSEKLLDPNDLVNLGLYNAEEWSICPTDKNFYENWIFIDDYENIEKTTGTILRYPDCTSGEPSPFEISEFIFLTNNSREAARTSEGMRPSFENYIGMACCDYTSQEIKQGDTSIWILRGNFPIEWSSILISVKEAVISIRVFGNQKLVEDDLISLAEIAVSKLLSQ